MADSSHSHNLTHLSELLPGKTIRASMSKRVSRANGEGYFAVEFEVASAGKYAAAIAEFRQQHYHPGMVRLLSGPTEHGQTSDNRTDDHVGGHTSTNGQKK